MNDQVIYHFIGIQTRSYKMGSNPQTPSHLGKVGSRWRLSLVEGGRHLLFYSEKVPDPIKVDSPPSEFENQLTESDEHKVRIIDGKKLVVAGFGGIAKGAEMKSEAEVLCMATPGVKQLKAMSKLGPMILRKTSEKYIAIGANGFNLFFFGQADIRPGDDGVKIENRLALADLHCKKIIDGEVYVVSQYGDTNFTLLPKWFDSAQVHPAQSRF